MRSSRSSLSVRHIQVLLEQERLSVRFLAKRQMSFEEEAEMEENLVQRPDVQDVWDGLTWLPPSMDADFREQQMLHLLS